VYRFALYLSGDAELAQDITSETFLRVWIAGRPVRLSSVKAWLFVIARNVYRHELRYLRPKTSLDPAMASIGSLPAVAEARENLAYVLKALAALTEADRFALLLRAVEGLSYTEIAATARRGRSPRYNPGCRRRSARRDRILQLEAHAAFAAPPRFSGWIRLSVHHPCASSDRPGLGSGLVWRACHSAALNGLHRGGRGGLDCIYAKRERTVWHGSRTASRSRTPAGLGFRRPISWGIGLKLRQFRTLDELDRPQSLFDESDR
jgi:RNA polymerase sigma factor (sigma-70 family)